MESEEQQTNTSEKVKFQFTQMILHDLSHMVAALRSETEILKRRETLSEKGTEHVEMISQLAGDIASGLKLINFYGSDEELILCDFFDEVLRTVISFSERYRHGFRVFIERAIRDAPKVLLRPGPARRALTLAISSTRPEKIRCTAKSLKDNVIFHFDLQGIQYFDETYGERLRFMLDLANLKLVKANWKKNVALLTLEFEVSK